MELAGGTSRRYTRPIGFACLSLHNSFMHQPTNVRFRVLAFLAAMTFILYLDRVCIAQALPEIQRDLGLGDRETGLVLAAFMIAYGLFEVPTGRLADRYGSRRVLTRIVLWWSAFTALTGLATGLWMLLVVRFLFGAGEAGALPSAVRIVSRWFPPHWRGKAQGIITTAMILGGATAPVVAAAMIAAVGWRLTFVLFGVVGVFWAIPFYWWFRDVPSEHPATNQAERDLARSPDDSKRDEEARKPIPWAAVLGSRNVWLLGLLMTCAAGVFYVFVSWYPKYLQQGLGATPAHSGTLASFVLMGGAFGSIFGGLITDRLFSVARNVRLARCGVGVIAYSVGACAAFAGASAQSPESSAAWFALTVFCIQTQIPAWWAAVIGISGGHVGSMSGLMNSLGVIGGASSQLYVGFAISAMADRGFSGREQWAPPLYIYGGIMLLGALTWMFVRPEKPIVKSTAC